MGPLVMEEVERIADAWAAKDQLEIMDTERGGFKVFTEVSGQGSTPEEICDAVRFILAAPAMTGQMIALDGGQHLGWAQPGRDGDPEEE